MADRAAPTSQAPSEYDAYAAHDDHGYGWVAFAGTLLLIRRYGNRIGNAD